MQKISKSLIVYMFHITQYSTQSFCFKVICSFLLLFLLLLLLSNEFYLLNNCKVAMKAVYSVEAYK